MLRRLFRKGESLCYVYTNLSKDSNKIMYILFERLCFVLVTTQAVPRPGFKGRGTHMMIQNFIEFSTESKTEARTFIDSLCSDKPKRYNGLF